jgi:hypothetical protein
MVTLTSLWLPILLSAVAVFLASFVLHMVLTYHRSDYRGLTNEQRVMDAVRGTSPGATYMFPYCATPKEASAPAMVEKFKAGPVGILTVLPSGPPSMAKNLAQWFVFCVVVGVFVAYLASRTVPAGAQYLMVFRIAGTVAFLGYAGAEVTNSIWRGQAWGVTVKNTVDGLVYALLTAGVFGWLWPNV